MGLTELPEIVAPLTVACKFEWSGNTNQGYTFTPCPSANTSTDVPLSLEAAEPISSTDAAKPKAPVDPNPLSSLRPLSTNTFCVPDDSDIEELPNPNIDLPDEAVDGFHAAALKASQEAFSCVAKDASAKQENNPPQEMPHTSQAQRPGCIILEQDKIDYSADEDPGKIDYSDENSDDFVNSDDEESDLESSAPPSSGLSSFNHVDISDKPNFNREGLLDYSASEFESDDESAASSHARLLDNGHVEFINPDVLMQNDYADAATFAHASEGVSEEDVNSAAPATTEGLKLSSEKPGSVHVEICGGIHLPHPHSVVASGECSQHLPTLESNQQPVYEDGPFSASGSDRSAIKQPAVKLPAWPLKRKISEMETQDAQIVDSIAPSTQVDLDTIAKPEVVDAISSALSESEPPKKRVKSSPSPSGTVASYTATAVISALLGGLGTIALLAALPAEYFQ